jgi:hypothetical protein
LAVGRDVEDPAISGRQPGFPTQGLSDFGRNPCGLGLVVSTRAIDDLDLHR